MLSSLLISGQLIFIMRIYFTVGDKDFIHIAMFIFYGLTAIKVDYFVSWVSINFGLKLTKYIFCQDLANPS